MSEEKIRIGTHGEDYGNWMSSPVFYMLGALLALSIVLTVMSFLSCLAGSPGSAGSMPLMEEV